MKKRASLMILALLTSIALVGLIPASANACNSGRWWHAGAYKLDYDVAGVSSYIKVRNPYNPNTTLYFTSARTLLSVWNSDHSNFHTAEVGWRKGIPFGSNVRHYVGIWNNNGWNIYNRGTPTVGSSYYYRVDHSNQLFAIRINGAVQRYDSLATSTIVSVEATAETNNDCASMGTSSAPTYLSKLQILSYSGTWSNWTTWDEQESSPYHTDWNVWDRANIWAWGP